MPFTPYLVFQGQCAEAFAFYGEVFGATVTMAYGPTFYAEGFGTCTDRFGTSWMISHGMAGC